MDECRDAAGLVAMPMRTRSAASTSARRCCCAAPAGWGEFSPFLEYDDAECAPLAGRGRARRPTSAGRRRVRDVGAGQRDRAGGRAAAGCRRRAGALRRLPTAKVKVAQAGQAEADDVARVAAVRDALGRDGPGAGRRQRRLGRRHRGPDGRGCSTGVDLEYVEQPCRTVEELRRGAPAGRRAGRRRRERSARPRTRCGSPGWRPPTSWCSRCSRSAGCAPACGSPSRSACRSSCRPRSTPRSASPPGSRWPRRCPSCRTPAGWRRWRCSTATSPRPARGRRRRAGRVAPRAGPGEPRRCGRNHGAPVARQAAGCAHCPRPEEHLSDIRHLQLHRRHP